MITTDNITSEQLEEMYWKYRAFQIPLINETPFKKNNDSVSYFFIQSITFGDNWINASKEQLLLAEKLAGITIKAPDGLRYFKIYKIDTSNFLDYNVKSNITNRFPDIDYNIVLPYNDEKNINIEINTVFYNGGTDYYEYKNNSQFGTEYEVGENSKKYPWGDAWDFRNNIVKTEFFLHKDIKNINLIIKIKIKQNRKRNPNKRYC